MKKIVLIVAFMAAIFDYSTIQAKSLIPNDILLPTIISLVEDGKIVTFSPTGGSMRPFIYEGNKVQLEQIQKIEIGDIVLAHLPQSIYVLHRVIGYSDSVVTLMGDGNIRGREYCHPDSIKVRCSKKIDKNGNSVSFDTNIQKSRAELWRKSLTQREQLLSSIPSEPDSTFWINVFKQYLSTGDRGMTIRDGYELRMLSNNPVKCIIFSNQDTIVDFTDIITLNETAFFLFNKMRNKCVNVQDLAHELTKEYDIDITTATKDCYYTLYDWFNRGWIKFCL